MPERSTPDQTWQFGDVRDEVVDRAGKRGLKWSIVAVTYADTDGVDTRNELRLEFPNGRSTRPLMITRKFARVLLASNFEQWTVLGNYAAYLDRSTGVIEAAVQGVGRRGGRLSEVSRLPGILREEVNRSANLSREESENPAVDQTFSELLRDDGDDLWRLPVAIKGQERVLEIRRASDEVCVLEGRPLEFTRGLSITITGIDSERHEDALALLERYSVALFFELDVKFQIPLGLTRQRASATAGGRARRIRSQSPLSALGQAYPPQPVSMYFYGRSAVGMPLLEYLAFYQAIEFFFPSFSNADILRRVRQRLRDPRFDTEDDTEIQKLVLLARGAKGVSSEKEQLRTTLEACVDEDELREYIGRPSDRSRFFTNDNPIAGTEKIKVGTNARIVDQVAARVYSIRCRIVHTKELGGAGDSDPILPFGTEAEALRYDVSLIQFLAQKVIIAGSRGAL